MLRDEITGLDVFLPPSKHNSKSDSGQSSLKRPVADARLQCYGSGMFTLDPEYRIRIFPSWIQGQKDSGSRIRIKEFKDF